MDLLVANNAGKTAAALLWGAVAFLCSSALSVGSALAIALGTGATAGSLALLVRTRRSGLLLQPDALVVRNLGQDYRLTWDQVASVTAARSTNVTQAVTCLFVHRTDGSALPVMMTGSYSAAKVREQLEQVHTWREQQRRPSPPIRGGC